MPTNANSLGQRPMHHLPVGLLQRDYFDHFHSDIRIQPPAPGQVRVRRLVHRGAPRPVYKFFSIKLNRVVQCESFLEVEAGQLLDACPAVSAFAEQPVVIHYEIDESLHRHIPDFAVWTGGRREFVEVKFKKDLTEEVVDRTLLLSNLLTRLGWGYRLITEDDIRAGFWLWNARKLLRRGREIAPQPWPLKTYDLIRRRGQVPLAHFGWEESGRQDAAWIASELIQGHFQVDRSTPLTADSVIYLGSDTIATRGLPW